MPMQRVESLEEARPFQSRLGYTTAGHLASSPQIWTAVIRELKRSDPLPSTAELDALHVLQHAVEHCDDAQWTIARDHGFVTAVAELASHNCICGFTRETLASSQGQDIHTMHFISVVMDVLTSSLERVTADTPWRSDDESEKLLNILQGDIIQMYDNIWEIRSPLLVSEFAHTKTGPIVVPLHDSLSFLVMAAAVILKLYRDFEILQPTSRIPHVLLLIWAYSPDQEVRFHSILRIVENHDEARESPLFLSVYDDEFVGRDRIIATLVRDLKDERMLNDRLLSTLECANLFASLEPEEGDPRLQWAEPLLIPYALAAARRQVCLGTDQDNLCNGISSIAFDLVHDQILNLSSVAGKHIYELIGLVCRFAKDIIATNEPEGLDILLDTLWWLSPLLRAQPLDPDDNRPKALAVRRYTYKMWREATEDFSRRRLALRSDDWKEFSTFWKIVGRAIPEVSDEEHNESPFEPLARCAWRRCLCSVHKPKHHMRVCKGCWIVAYCGKGCQTDDWLDGHRERCRRNLE